MIHVLEKVSFNVVNTFFLIALQHHKKTLNLKHATRCNIGKHNPHRPDNTRFKDMAWKGKNNHHRDMPKRKTKCNIDTKLNPTKQHVVTS